MQRRTRNVIAIALIERFGSAEHRQQHAEDGLPRLGFAFDDTAVIADDFGYQRKTQPATGLLGRDKWIEQVREQIFRHARAVVFDAEFERQRYPRFLSWHRQANAGTEGGGKLNFSIIAEIDHGLGGILDQIQKDLDQLVLVGEHRRQGRIVVFDEADIARKPRLRQPLDVVEHRMNVDGAARHRPVVAEYFHTIDQCDDAIRLVAYQSRQHAIFG